ncbi:T17B22.17 PROTEIN, partial [Salix koriyanagi]
MEEGSGTAADGNKGPIVWVRRRNGSWWPGQIMEADELAVHNLTSPRTGTPVKLLGRDDASV